MKHCRSLTFAFLAFCVLIFAQSPNIQQSWTFLGTGTSAAVSNAGVTGAASWRLSFRPTGFTAASVQVETAEDCSGSPCSTWTAIAAANFIEGVNPIVWTSSDSPPTSQTNAFVFTHPWYRVHVVSVSGSGSLTSLLLGYRGASTSLTQ